MEEEEKIQAHVLSVWKESRGFFTGKGKEGMLILTNKQLYFISKTEAGIKWWGAIRTRQVVRLLQFKDVMIVEDGYGLEKLREDLENKKNQKISFNNILQIEVKEKIWGSVLFLDVIEDGKEKKFQGKQWADLVKNDKDFRKRVLQVMDEEVIKKFQNKCATKKFFFELRRTYFQQI